MKSFELTVQQQWNFCLCSVMQAIFRKYGLDFSQEEIAENLTPSRRGFLYHDKRARIFMQKYGFSYSGFGVHETPFNEPYEVLKEMCEYGGILGVNGHAYLLKSFHDPEIKLIDPKDGREVRKDYSDLLKEMGPGDFFGLIKHIS